MEKETLFLASKLHGLAHNSNTEDSIDSPEEERQTRHPLLATGQFVKRWHILFTFWAIEWLMIRTLLLPHLDFDVLLLLRTWQALRCLETKWRERGWPAPNWLELKRRELHLKMQSRFEHRHACEHEAKQRI